MDFQEFLNVYAANFRNLNKNDGVDYWRKFVEQSDEELLIETIEDMAEQRLEEGKNIVMTAPKLAEVRIEYFSRLRDKKIREQEKALLEDGTCNICENSGVVWVAETRNKYTGKIYLLNPTKPEPIPYDDVHIVCAPCLCQIGYDCDANVPYKKREEYIKYRFIRNKDEPEDVVGRIFAQQCDELYRQQQSHFNG